jgi:hypothetical protein
MAKYMEKRKGYTNITSVYTKRYLFNMFCLDGIKLAEGFHEGSRPYLSTNK